MDNDDVGNQRASCAATEEDVGKPCGEGRAPGLRADESHYEPQCYRYRLSVDAPLRIFVRRHDFIDSVP